MWLTRQLKDDFSMDSFQDRMWLQKIVVLAQEFGIPMNYRFGWYKHGPYASPLTEDAFTIDSIPEVSWPQYIELADMDENRNKVDQLNDLIEIAKSKFMSMTEAKILELLASLVFIVRHAYPRPDSKDAAFESLEKYKSFSPEQMEIAWEILLNVKLVNS